MRPSSSSATSRMRSSRRRWGDYILYKNLEGKYLTLQDCLDENKEKHENTIFYVTDEKEQSQYIYMFKEQGIDAVIMPAALTIPLSAMWSRRRRASSSCALIPT